MQKLVLQSLRLRLLTLSHYPQLAKHPKQRRMCDTMRIDRCWPTVVNNVLQTTSGCHSCAMYGTQLKYKRHLQLFFATGPIEFFAMNFLGLLSKMRGGS